MAADVWRGCLYAEIVPVLQVRNACPVGGGL
jgi:hypothetical protein